MINEEISSSKLPAFWRLIEDSKRQLCFLRTTIEMLNKRDEDAEIMKRVLFNCAKRAIKKPLTDQDYVFFYYIGGGEIGVTFIYGRLGSNWKAIGASNFGREAFKLSRKIFDYVTDSEFPSESVNLGDITDEFNNPPRFDESFAETHNQEPNASNNIVTYPNDENFSDKSPSRDFSENLLKKELEEEEIPEYSSDSDPFIGCGPPIPLKEEYETQNAYKVGVVCEDEDMIEAQYEMIVDDDLSDLSIHQIDDIEEYSSQPSSFQLNAEFEGSPKQNAYLSDSCIGYGDNVTSDSEKPDLTNIKKRKICKICGKTFSTRSCLNRHLIIHRNEWPHSCPTCGKAFRRADHLKAHVELYKGRQHFMCEICSRTYSDPSLYRKHKRIHFRPKSSNANRSQLHLAQLPNQSSEPQDTVPGRVACKQCGKHVSQTYIARHLRLHRKKLFPFGEKLRPGRPAGTSFRRKQFLLHHVSESRKHRPN